MQLRLGVGIYDIVRIRKDTGTPLEEDLDRLLAKAREKDKCRKSS